MPYITENCWVVLAFFHQGALIWVYDIQLLTVMKFIGTYYPHSSKFERLKIYSAKIEGIEHDLKGLISLGRMAKKKKGAHCIITSLPRDNSQRESECILGKKPKHIIASQPQALAPKMRKARFLIQLLLILYSWKALFWSSGLAISISSNKNLRLQLLPMWHIGVSHIPSGT